MRISLLKTVAFIMMILLSASVQAQVMDTLWTESYGMVDQHDSTNCLQETSDEGFIMVGYTQQYGEIQTDIKLVKTDSDGNEEWTKIIGDGNLESGYHVIETSDGGYLVSAKSDAFGSGLGDFRIWIIKTDENGDTLWSYPFTYDNGNGFPLCAVETSDGGYAITGIINVDYDNKAFILKLNDDGSHDWHYWYGDSYPQDAWFIAQMPDDGYIVAGNFRNTYTTDWDFWAFRTNEAGVVVWDSVYALTDYTDLLYGACVADDGMVMVGLARGSGHAIKIDFDGNTVWSKSIAIYPTAEKYTSVCATSDDGFMVGGWVNVAGYRRDYCFQKLDADGDTLWTFTVGGSEDDHGRSVVETSDGCYALAGNSASFPLGWLSFWLVKIGLVTDVPAVVSADLPAEFRLSRNYPNPFNPMTTFSYSIPSRTEVSLVIYNVLGQKVRVL